jgi:hypothetical protein
LLTQVQGLDNCYSAVRSRRNEHGKTRYLVYNGGTPKYVAAITDVAERGYEGIAFDAGAQVSARSATAAE